MISIESKLNIASNTYGCISFFRKKSIAKWKYLTFHSCVSLGLFHIFLCIKVVRFVVYRCIKFDSQFFNSVEDIDDLFLEMTMLHEDPLKFNEKFKYRMKIRLLHLK